MSERTHSSSDPLPNSSKQKAVWLLAGTAVAFLVAGVAFQLFRPPAADAGRDPTEKGQAETGKASVSGPQRRTGIAGRVNGQTIPWDLVAEECMDRYGEEVLEKIINRTIIYQACREQGIVVSATKVEDEISKIAQRFNLDVDSWFKMLQAERNISPTQYRRDVIWPMLALKALAGENVEVTEEMLQEAFVRDYGEKVKAKLIVLDNLRRAQKVWAEAREEPERFGELAREYSIEPNSRALSGAIPPIRRYSDNKELEKAAFSLKEGEISGIVQVGLSRYVIILCEGRTRQIVEFDEVKENLYQHVMEAQVQESVARVFSAIKEGAEIHNHLTNTSIKGVKTVSGSNQGRVTSAAGTGPSPGRRADFPAVRNP
jgi:foldase protein PrsA